MELNLYDIVEYNGNNHRIMAIDSYDGDLDLAGVDIWINPDSVTLVEPFIPQTFEIGDEVIILQIPPEEQTDYPCGWGCKIIHTQINTSIFRSGICGGLLYLINNFDDKMTMLRNDTNLFWVLNLSRYGDIETLRAQN